jgi:hypothetical protein
MGGKLLGIIEAVKGVAWREDYGGGIDRAGETSAARFIASCFKSGGRIIIQQFAHFTANIS